jgi:hypothetical protein
MDADQPSLSGTVQRCMLKRLLIGSLRRTALRGLGFLLAATLTALAPGFRSRDWPCRRPLGPYLQAGRNDARERRLRLARLRQGVAPAGVKASTEPGAAA